MEEYSECPITIGFQGFSKPLHWEKWNQSPEYFHACAGSMGGVDTLIGVPQNGMGYQYAFHGDAYVGIAAYPGSFPVNGLEYFGCELVAPLQVGESYYLSFWTNVAGGWPAGGSYWGPRQACNNLGMLFTMEHNIWTSNDGPNFPVRNYAHLRSEEVIDNHEEWVQVSGWFTADSAYNYLVIGNFFSNELTSAIHLFPDLPGNPGAAYYFVDGVCVSLDPIGCDFHTSVEQISMSALRMYPNPASNEIIVDHRGNWAIHDMLGNLLLNGFQGGGVIRVNVALWPEGQYVFTLKDNTGTLRSKFVVMH